MDPEDMVEDLLLEINLRDYLRQGAQLCRDNPGCTVMDLLPGIRLGTSNPNVLAALVATALIVLAESGWDTK